MTTTSPRTDVAVDALPTRGRAWVSIAALCLGGLAASLSQTLIIPIQGELPELLGTSAANASWVVTATLLAGAVAMPIAGSLGDLFGKQRVLLASALILLTGSVTVAASDSLVPVLLGRGLQGLAMGFIPVGISLIREITPPDMAATGIAAMSATLGVGGGVGMPLSAYIVEYWDWHTVFWLTAALAALVVVTTYAAVPHIHDAHGGRFDVPGAIGLAAGLTLLLVAITKGNDWGWGTARPWSLGTAGLLVLVGWGWLQLRTRLPLVDLRTTARRPVLLANIAAIAIGFGMMAQAIVVPQLMVLPIATGHGFGQTILEAGLWMAPGGLGMLLFTPVSAMLLRRIGARSTLIIGAFVVGVGYLFAFALGTAPLSLMFASLIGSAGIGIGYAAMPTLIMQHVPEREAGAAVGLNGLMRSIGTTSASAVMVVILTASTMSYAGTTIPTEAAFKLCFLVGAGAAFVGAAIGCAIPRGRRRI